MNFGLIKKITKTKGGTKIRIKLDCQVKVDSLTYNVLIYKDGNEIKSTLIDETEEVCVDEKFGDMVSLLNKKCEFEINATNSASLELISIVVMENENGNG